MSLPQANLYFKVGLRNSFSELGDDVETRVDCVDEGILEALCSIKGGFELIILTKSPLKLVDLDSFPLLGLLFICRLNYAGMSHILDLVLRGEGKTIAIETTLRCMRFWLHLNFITSCSLFLAVCKNRGLSCHPSTGCWSNCH